MSNPDLTIATYDRSSEDFARYFQDVGPRTELIEKALKLRGTTEGLSVVEIGCGNGRDAEEIVQRVSRYEGFDPSEGMLKLARDRLPGHTFTKADALSYNYPKGTDLVLAFASLLHVNMGTFREVCCKVHAALAVGGIFLMTLKERKHYDVELVTDQFGDRMFYYYNAAMIGGLIGQGFEKVYEEHTGSDQPDDTKWLLTAFRKI